MVRKHGESFSSAGYKKEQKNTRRRSLSELDIPVGKNPVDRRTREKLRCFVCK